MLELVRSILEKISPANLFEKEIDEIDLTSFDKIHIFGVGKAASPSVKRVYDLLKRKVAKNRIGQVISYTKKNHSLPGADFVQIEGDHPQITKDSLAGTNLVLNKLINVSEYDALIFLLSGGASALLEKPHPQFSFEEVHKVTDALIHSGAPIESINGIRKELSLVKNGGLQNFCKARQVFNWVISDVPSDEISMVGSSPFYFEEGDKKKICEDITSYLPDGFLRKKILGFLETSKHKASNHLEIENKIVSGFSLFKRVVEKELGVRGLTQIYTFDIPFNDSVEKVVEDHIKVINDQRKVEAIFSGGEGAVSVKKNDGKGGRNTHFVALLAHELFSHLPDNATQNIKILSVGTDGSDGETDAAGAWLDYETYRKFKDKLDLESYLENFDSYNYFKETGTLLKTGPTGTNVMDLRIIFL